jgi:hypothetical protein
MIASPNETLNRVLEYYVTKPGRKKIGNFDGTAISGSVLTIGQALASL